MIFLEGQDEFSFCPFSFYLKQTSLGIIRILKRAC